jgi:hypothetical protein
MLNLIIPEVQVDKQGYMSRNKYKDIVITTVIEMNEAL